jgi:hypothetical protein
MNTISEDKNLFDDSTASESNQNQHSASKQCSGKDCTRIARNLLMILYINKKGYFCDECTHDLLSRQLAKRIQEVSLTD